LLPLILTVMMMAVMMPMGMSSPPAARTVSGKR
jgi:hypothetical protein